MSTKLDTDLAFCAASAYANSPGTNKTDPTSFGKAVRQVFDAAMQASIDPLVFNPGLGIRPGEVVKTGNTLKSIDEFCEKMAKDLCEVPLGTLNKPGDLKFGDAFQPDRIYVTSGFATEAQLNSMVRTLRNARINMQQGCPEAAKGGFRA